MSLSTAKITGNRRRERRRKTQRAARDEHRFSSRFDNVIRREDQSCGVDDNTAGEALSVMFAGSERSSELASFLVVQDSFTKAVCRLASFPCSGSPRTSGIYRFAIPRTPRTAQPSHSRPEFLFHRRKKLGLRQFRRGQKRG